ncbi:MAG: transposase [Desulfobacterales bacterium]|nr:transposase [Desulfobacterales bacterium]
MYARHPWFSLFPEFSDAVAEILKKTALDAKATLSAWCIMPDHLLVECKHLVGFVRTFKGRATAAARAVDPGRRLWQRSFYDHLLRKEEDVRTVAQYIWENPVRAGIVDKSEKCRRYASGNSSAAFLTSLYFCTLPLAVIG